MVGPLIDAGQVAEELLAELRDHGRGALAENLAALIGGASIGCDPFALLMDCQRELARPMVDSGPLMMALIVVLRNERRGEMADGVAALLMRVKQGANK